MSSLLSALGLSDNNPVPPPYHFDKRNPMGTPSSSSSSSSSSVSNDEHVESATSEGAWLMMSSKCNEAVGQVIKLVRLDECVSASDRVLTASVTLMSRRIILKLLSSLTQDGYQSLMEDIQLNNVQHLIRLLRLVQANRVGMITEGGEGLKEVIGSAIASITSKSKVGGAGTQLLQV